MKHFVRSMSVRMVTLVMCETGFIIAAVLLAAYIRLGSDVLVLLRTEPVLWKAVLIAGVVQLCLYVADLYDLRIVADRRELFVRVLQALGSTSLILGTLYYWFPALIVGRGVFLVAAALVLTLVAGWRIGFEWFAHQVGPRERILLVGTNPAATRLARELFDRRAELGVEIVGFVDPDPARIGTTIINPGVIGTIDSIPDIVDRYQVDRVVVSLTDARGQLPMDQLLQIKLSKGVAFDHLASVYEEYTGKIAVENLRPSWLIFSSGFKKGRLLLATKRTFDVVISALGLLLAFPVMLMVGALVKLTSPGPALYHQTRVGLNGRVFTVHKFRSMRQDAEARSGAVWSQPKDPRITPIGRFLRKTRLDELPQLWNILIGDMSAVGPRPERPEFVADLTRQIPFYGQRHVARPGLTGWAQVQYAYGANAEDALEKLQYDLYYIKNMSIALDLFIVFSTLKTVVLRKGA